jgi:hypothetical protein
MKRRIMAGTPDRSTRKERTLSARRGKRQKRGESKVRNTIHYITFVFYVTKAQAQEIIRVYQTVRRRPSMIWNPVRISPSSLCVSDYIIQLEMERLVSDSKSI